MLDLLTSQLADAPLTPRQHAVWRNLCQEVIHSRQRIRDLETRLEALETKPAEDEGIQTVLTRPEFNREVARMLAFDERYGGLSSVLYFDVENLDHIVSACGRTVAEAVIRCVSDALAESIRKTDILGRLAPDEFGILLPRCDNANAWKKGEQIAGAVFEALDRMGVFPIRPNVTYGAYTFQEKEDLATGLKQAAQNVTKGEKVRR